MAIKAVAWPDVPGRAGRGAGLVAAMLLGLMAPAQAQDHADEDEMPELSVEQALALHQEPRAWMVDAVTCERVSAVTDPHGRLVGAGGGVALYRQENPRRPFMRVTTRKDGAYVARFPASPGEVIISRAFVRHPRTNQSVYGRATEVVCVDQDVAVGEVSVVDPQEEMAQREPPPALPALEEPRQR